MFVVEFLRDQTDTIQRSILGKCFQGELDDTGAVQAPKLKKFLAHMIISNRLRIMK